MRGEARREALAFAEAAAVWGAPRPSAITWGSPIVPPGVPTREGVTLCAPWVEEYERELRRVASAAGEVVPPLPSVEEHPNATVFEMMLLRDEHRREVHSRFFPALPNPWQHLVSLWLLGITINALFSAFMELRLVPSFAEARRAALRGGFGV